MSLEKIEIAAKWTTKLAENANTSDIVKYIEDFRESKNGKKINEKFNTLSEKDKMNLYKDGWLNIGKFLKTNIAVWAIGRIQSLVTYESKKLKAFGPEVSTLYRVLVHMGVVDMPSWLEHEELIKNVKKDAKFYNATITVAQVGCMAFAPEAEPFLTALKPMVKTLSKKAVEISEIQQKNLLNQDNKEVELIEKNTKNDLQENLNDIKQKTA